MSKSSLQAAQTSATEDRLKEGSMINKSLSALGYLEAQRFEKPLEAHPN